MRRCDRAPEPRDFDAQVRQPGKTWLVNNPGKVPKDYWSRCKEELADVFRCRCAYTAMRILPKHSGTVDHFLSKRNRPDLAYEWSNYRYATNRVNSCKANYDDKVLDPFEIQDEWFEVQIPSLQLVLTDKLPPEMRSKAEFTLKQLQLQDSDWIIEQRAYYYDNYRAGLIKLEIIERDAPLLAKAIRDYYRN